jgi:hypothetical protein
MYHGYGTYMDGKVGISSFTFSAIMFCFHALTILNHTDTFGDYRCFFATNLKRASVTFIGLVSLIDCHKSR